MAHTKAQRAVRGNRDSIAKRLGVKIYGGQVVKTGFILLKQRGTKVLAGPNVLLSKDQSLIALKNGVARYYKKMGKQYITIDEPEAVEAVPEVKSKKVTSA